MLPDVGRSDVRRNFKSRSPALPPDVCSHIVCVDLVFPPPVDSFIHSLALIEQVWFVHASGISLGVVACKGWIAGFDGAGSEGCVANLCLLRFFPGLLSR